MTVLDLRTSKKKEEQEQKVRRHENVADPGYSLIVVVSGPVLGLLNSARMIFASHSCRSSRLVIMEPVIRLILCDYTIGHGPV
jgi:hypothetical protein